MDDDSSRRLRTDGAVSIAEETVREMLWIVLDAKFRTSFDSSRRSGDRSSMDRGNQWRNAYDVVGDGIAVMSAMMSFEIIMTLRAGEEAFRIKEINLNKLLVGTLN